MAMEQEVLEQVLVSCRTNCTFSSSTTKCITQTFSCHTVLCSTQAGVANDTLKLSDDPDDASTVAMSVFAKSSVVEPCDDQQSAECQDTNMQPETSSTQGTSTALQLMATSTDKLFEKVVEVLRSS